MAADSHQPRERHHRLPPELYRGLVRVAFTLCMRDRREVLCLPPVAAHMLRVLTECLRRGDCVALAYCFMPDHLHLVLEGRSAAADTREVVARFKQSTGYWLSCTMAGVHWQKDYYDTILRTPEEAWDRVRYVLANPLRWGLVEHWCEYPASGCLGVTLDDVLGEPLAGCRLNEYADRGVVP